ncbi:MAG TPA: Ppx/GppA family phosphatase [Bacillus bacterium]|nr:Ppx/GppA family phosphatase [Bacillus sp. (in: firmicutes)]
MQEKYGIIDIGSNTMRLVIYRHEKIGGFKEIENIKSVARLRNYLNEENCLNESGIKILLNTLKYFAEITTFHAVTTIKVVATATIRHAKNQQEILREIRAHTNLNVRILSDYEEAYYGYLAVVNSTSLTEGITIDIGGGSTEVTYFKDRKLIYYHSFPFGVLTLRQQFMAEAIPTVEELLELQAYLIKEISTVNWLKDKKIPIIGIGGSARNIAQIDQRSKLYPLGGLHQYKMNGTDLINVKNSLTGLSLAELKRMEGLSEDRADIIFPALEVFHVMYQVTNASAFILSRKGLREGVFFEELLKPIGIKMFPDVIEESLFEIEYEYGIHTNNVIQVSRIAVTILRLLQKMGFHCITAAHLREAKRAALLFQLGRYIDDEGSSQHTFYVLANRTIDGLMHRERLRLAAIASYKSKTILKQYLEPFKEWISKDELNVIKILGAVLRFAYALNETKRNIVEGIEITEEGENLIIDIICINNWQAERYQAEKQKKHLEKALKRDIILHFTCREATHP